MELPTRLEYPVVVIGDLHGQRAELEELVAKIDARTDWPEAAFAFLGDFLDRGPDPRGALDLVLELLARPRGGSAVRGNHDHAVVHATGLDGGEPSMYWGMSYLIGYDAGPTLASYLGEDRGGKIPLPRDLPRLADAIPAAHGDFLAALPWVVELEGHLLLHNGLSTELDATAEEQVAALHDRDWSRDRLRPVPGTKTDRKWVDEYPDLAGCGARALQESAPAPWQGAGDRPRAR